MSNECKITLGIVIRNSRKYLGISQRELCQELSKYGVQIDHYELSRIENNRIAISDPKYNSLIQSLCQILNLDIVYIEIIKQQTEIAPPNDLTKGVFPIYVKDLT